MNENERELMAGLRVLAADGPGQAPAQLEERLLGEFRNRKHRRRLAARLQIGGVATIAAGTALFIGMRQEAPKSAPVAATVEARAPLADEEAGMSFYPLPEAEALPPVENAVVVRVQLPASALGLLGFPVSDELAGAAVEADLLLGQDGLARGVRLAQ